MSGRGSRRAGEEKRNGRGGERQCKYRLPAEGSGEEKKWQSFEKPECNEKLSWEAQERARNIEGER